MGWKRVNLSLAGRTTLVQSVSTAIPIHIMQSSWLPGKVSDRIDKFNRDILWSNDLNSRNNHLVGWHRVLRNKREGGLGLHSARFNNEALLSKICWKTLQHEENIWTDLVKDKYLKNVRIDRYVVKHNDSNTWKGIIKCMKLITPFFRWRIGDGATISFWFDNWLGETRLCDVIVDICHEDFGIRLRDVLDELGDWNLGILHKQLPHECEEKITRKHTLLRDEEDRPIWSPMADEKFRAKSRMMNYLGNTP